MRATKHGIIAAMLVLFLSSTVATVSAYQIYGGRWTDSDVRNLTWRMPEGSSWYWQLHYYTEQAAYSWNMWCPPVWFTEVSSSELVTYYSFWLEYGPLAFADIYPSFYQYPYSWGYVYFNEYYLDSGYYLGDWVHVQAVYAHEQGHILGLRHETAWGPYVLMYPYDDFYTVGGVYYPTWDEQGGIGYLYG